MALDFQSVEAIWTGYVLPFFLAYVIPLFVAIEAIWTTYVLPFFLAYVIPLYVAVCRYLWEDHNNGHLNGAFIAISLLGGYTIPLCANPPGGVTKNNLVDRDGAYVFEIGKAVAAYSSFEQFKKLMLVVHISMFINMSLIWLISIKVSKKRLFSVILVLMIFAQLVTTIMATTLSSKIVTPSHNEKLQELTNYFSNILTNFIISLAVVIGLSTALVVYQSLHLPPPQATPP